MANTILTPTQITREALRILHQKLNFVGNVKREYDDRFAQSGAKIGDTLQVRLPNQYTVRDGAAISTQDTTEKKVDLTVANQKGVDTTFTSSELTLDLQDFSERILEPAMSVLAANVEADALNMYKDVYQQVDGSGSAQTFAQLLSGRKKLTDSLAPSSPRSMILDTQANIDVVDALKGLFQDSSEIAKQYREGMVGRTAGFGSIFENTLLPRHTVGSQDGDYLVDGASQTGSSLTVDTGTGTLKKGDVLTIAGVNRVHPETKADSGEVQQFVVTADYTGGAGDVSIAPAIVVSGAYQNVSASPADNAAISVNGTASTAHGLSMGFHRDAFAFATADLEDVSQYGAWGSRQVFDGISMRVARQYDISNDTIPCRIDILYGYKAIRPELAVRLAAN